MFLCIYNVNICLKHLFLQPTNQFHSISILTVFIIHDIYCIPMLNKNRRNKPTIENNFHF